VRIGLNLLFVVPGETGGMETYVRALVPELARLVGPESLRLFVSPELAAELRPEPWFEGQQLCELRVPGRSRVRRTLAEQSLLPVLVRRARCELLHNLQSVAPAVSGAPRSVTTIHDLLYVHHPETHSPLLRRGMRFLVPMAARRSDRIIAISEATKADLVRTLGVTEAKIDVVHQGPGIADTVAPSDERELRERFSLGDAPILLSPSARRAHKNLGRLLEAFATVAAAPAPVLVLPGYATGAEDELLDAARRLGVADRVRFAGWVSDADLLGLYACSSALVYPSLAEGFGLPVLEAMRSGLPVACADRTSLPEIVGDAGLLFDPESADAIAAAIGRLLSDRELAAELAAKGVHRAAGFSWERTARETLASYERAVGT